MRKPRIRTHKRLSHTQRKQYKELKRQTAEANRKIDTLKGGGAVGVNSPALKHLTNNGNHFKASQAFGKNGLKKNTARRLTREAQQFSNAQTSTIAGAKKVLNQTLTNIATAHGTVTEADVKKYNMPEIIFDDDETGVHFVQRYFDVFYKAKEALESSHIYVSSDDLLQAINEELDDAVQGEISEHENDDGSAEVDFTLKVLSNDDFLNGVIDRLS